MNNFAAIGRLIADPEVKFLDGGKVVATATASVQRGNGKKNDQGYPESDLFKFEVWGKSGEALANHLKKGDPVWFRGRVELQRAKGDGAGFWVTVKDAAWGFVPKSSSNDGGSSSSSSTQADGADDF